MNEQEKKGTQPVRVHGRYPRKSGINMNMREDRTRELTMLIIGGVLICVLAGAAAKFGVKSTSTGGSRRPSGPMSRSTASIRRWRPRWRIMTGCWRNTAPILRIG